MGKKRDNELHGLIMIDLDGCPDELTAIRAMEHELRIVKEKLRQIIYHRFKEK